MATTRADRLGPGQLTFGDIGSTAEFGAKCTKVAVEPESEDGEVIDVLSGDQVVDDGADTFKITGSVFQEFTMSGLIAWSHEHHGEVVPFTFVPDTAGALQATGNVRIKRLTLGGDVRKRNQSEFEFPGVGDYELSAYDGGLGG